MSIDLAKFEPTIRLGFFIGILVAMAAWEMLAPRREVTTSKPLHWLNNLGLVFFNSLLLRLVAPLGGVGVAVLAESRGWGLFHVLAVPEWLAVLASVILLDLAIYLQHVIFHAVPLFWRLHMVHHADLDVDVTTGLRFHTIEIVLSFGIKAAVILLLGPPAVAVLIFEVLLNIVQGDRSCSRASSRQFGPSTHRWPKAACPPAAGEFAPLLKRLAIRPSNSHPFPRKQIWGCRAVIPRHLPASNSGRPWWTSAAAAGSTCSWRRRRWGRPARPSGST